MTEASAVSVPPESLNYGLAAPQRRKRWMRALVLLEVILLGVAAWQWGPSAWRQAQVRYYQRQCLNYTAPDDQVVYEEEPAAAAKLLVNRLEYEPFRWDMWAPANAKMPAAAASRMLPSYQSLERLSGRNVAVPGGTAYESILFLHERTTPKGERRLVKVTLWSAPFSFWAFVKESDEYGTRQWVQANRYPSFVEPLDTVPRHSVPPEPWPTHPPELRIFAGQPDPKDASHFTIRYQAWGQTDVMDGYLINDDTVTLKPRNPPSPP